VEIPLGDDIHIILIRQLAHLFSFHT